MNIVKRIIVYFLVFILILPVQVAADNLKNDDQEKVDTVNEDEQEQVSEVNEDHQDSVEETDDPLYDEKTVNSLAIYKTEQIELRGIALEHLTHVYSKTSRDSIVLRSYNQGHVLRYKALNSSWYEATVFVNGEPKTGYINVNDVLNVENIDSSPTDLQGIGLQNRTNVYASISRDAQVLRSYNQGHVLRYRTFIPGWYQATVYINGRARTGYIHENDVENIEIDEQQELRGIGLGNLTHVYSRASTNASVLRSYNQGHVLRYRTFTSGWYEATVFINGQARTGYIHSSDVEDIETSQESLSGIGLKNSTPVYSRASTNASVLRSYNQGHVLRYRTFTSGWYEATVYINGQAKTGYINRNDVQNVNNIDPSPKNLQGIALNSRTHVYSSVSRNSEVIRTYHQGQVLRYLTFISGWHKATVIINGEARTGYINTNDVENRVSTQESLKGLALNNRTYIYSRASTNSPILRTYDRDSVLQFRTFTSNWYEATVILNGQPTIGYIHHSDVNTGVEYQTTDYDYTFKEMIDLQMRMTPKANGIGTVVAGRNLIEYYVNPANFSRESASYYQFLVLSKPAGSDVNEINQKVLSNAGILTGRAQDFIDAGRLYNINEVYLLSHVLHETANGRSQLASGVEVNGKTVYNMYGIGAYDGCAVECGSKFAYEEGWFTPRDAIIGGAQWIENLYIARGQDTLYKMKWDPDAIERGRRFQYATHVSWAVLQTSRMSAIYNQLNHYFLTYDIPNYREQPVSTSSTPPMNVIEYSSAIGGATTANLNLRHQPNGNLITTLPNGTTLQVLGEDGFGWFKVRVGGQIGWVFGQYLSLNRHLEVTSATLNVRSEPSTEGGGRTIIGQVYQSYKVAAVLNNNNEFVTENGWYKVHYGNTTGWVSGSLVRTR